MAVLLLLSGCKENAVERAPGIRYGKDMCAECRMIIQDKRFASAFTDEKGNTFKFDDIGCMRVYMEGNAVSPKLFWVHDYNTEEWMNRQAAFLTYSKKLITPMGYGIAAFSSPQQAKEFLEKYQGQIVSWDEISETLQRKADIIKGGEDEAY